MFESFVLKICSIKAIPKSNVSNRQFKVYKRYYASHADYPVMKLVGMPCCPNDAVREIQQVSKYISDKNGGEGCARDVLEQVLRVQGKWAENFDAQYD